MAIVRFDPIRDLAMLHDRMNHLFGDVYGRRDEGSMSRWVPAVDIYENEKKALVLKAELPDVKRENVSVTVENNTLTLSGERKFDTDVRKDSFHRIERAYGTFTRSFSLPATVDNSKVAAEFKDGVLTVTLPYREEAKPRTINVEVAA